MKIHNFLCDLLVSTKLLLDQNIFKDSPGLIKHYEFNLGNRAFQFSKEPTVNYQLPAAIVTINDEQINFGGRRTDLIMQNRMENVNKIPILYNETQDLVVYVHEEQSTVGFTININCESQLQAKELAYAIKRFLPLNKVLNIFNFISYLELDTSLLMELLDFKIPFDTIHNLYTKLNTSTGKPEYCFALAHNPLIRIDSISTNTMDSTLSTYQISMDLTYVIQFPQYLIVDTIAYIDRINFSFNIDNSSIVTIPYSRFYIGLPPNYKIDRTLLIQTDQTDFTENIIISTSETQAIISIKFDINDFIIESKYKYRFYKQSDLVMTPVLKDPTYFYQSENRVVFTFDIEQYNKLLIPSNTNPLFVDFYYELEGIT